MADYTQGLFSGLPDAVAAQRQAAEEQSAQGFANMNPLQQQNYMMYRAGQGLAGVFGTDKVMQQAQDYQKTLMGGQADLGTSKGLFEKAAELKDRYPQQSWILIQKANELKKQEDAAAMAGRKQDFQEQQMYDLKLQQLAQQAEVAKQRSEDSRYSADARLQAAQEAAQARRDIAAMMAQMRRDVAAQSAAKPMTAAQQLKQKQAEAKSIGGVRLLDDTVKNTSALIDQIEKHEGVGGATGMRSLLWSKPGGSAQQAESLIDEFKAQTALAGLNLTRQGGGIGAMTEKEWPLVERMVAAIDPRNGKEAMVAQMRKVQSKIEQLRENARMAHSEMFDGEVPSSPATPPAAAPSARKFKVLGKE